MVKTFSFTLPEGRSRLENVPAVKKAFTGELRQGDDRTALPAPRARRLGAPRSARTLEGFLFPATYQMITGASASDLVERQLDAFRENVAKVDMGAAKKRNLTRYDVLIIASMVEREAQLPERAPADRGGDVQPPQAGHPARHRRDDPLPDQQLGAPAARLRAPARHAVQHAHAAAACRRRRSATRGSPRSRPPPTRRKTKYLFFVRKPGKTGEHAFSSTNSQFERDVARYQASRGG